MSASEIDQILERLQAIEKEVMLLRLESAGLRAQIGLWKWIAGFGVACVGAGIVSIGFVTG